MAIEILEETDVRRIAREEAARPVFVTQRSVEAVIGLPRKHYLRDARAKLFLSTTKNRLVIAKTADVLATLELRLSATSGGTVANDADSETVMLSRVGARRVSK